MLPPVTSTLPASRGAAQVPSTWTSAARVPCTWVTAGVSASRIPRSDAVGVGADRDRPIEPALLRSLEREVERKVRFDLQDVLSGAPEIEIRVEPPVGIVDDALDERRVEIAEPAIGQTGDAAQRRRRRGAADLDREPHVPRDAERIAPEQRVQVVEVEALYVDGQRSGRRGRDSSLGAHDPGPVGGEQGERPDRRGRIGERDGHGVAEPIPMSARVPCERIEPDESAPCSFRYHSPAPSNREISPIVVPALHASESA